MLNPAKRWTGEVDVSVVSSKENPLSDEDYYGVLEFCGIICANIPMMEKDASLRTKAVDLKTTRRTRNAKRKAKDN